MNSFMIIYNLIFGLTMLLLGIKLHLKVTPIAGILCIVSTIIVYFIVRRIKNKKSRSFNKAVGL